MICYISPFTQLFTNCIDSHPGFMSFEMCTFMIRIFQSLSHTLLDSVVENSYCSNTMKRVYDKMGFNEVKDIDTDAVGYVPLKQIFRWHDDRQASGYVTMIIDEPISTTCWLYINYVVSAIKNNKG